MTIKKVKNLTSDSNVKPAPLQHEPMLIDAEAAHKQFAAKIVLPVMSVTTLTFYAATVTANKAAALVAVAGITITALNFWITTLTGTWRSTNFKPRADLVDAVRWGFNLVIFDAAIMALLKPSTATLAMTWTILLLAASADMFRQAYRSIVVSLGLICGIALLFSVPGDIASIRQQVFAVFSMVTIVFVFLKIETYWTSELQSRIQAQQQKAESEFRIKGLTRDAMLGVQSRMISHELANLIQILDMIAQRNDPAAHEKLRRTVFYIKRVNKLVLQDLGHSEVEKRDNFGSIIDNVQMLVLKEMGLGENLLTTKVEDEARNFDFNEYSGSLFLVLRNLLKNAAEAKKDGDIKTHITLVAKISGQHLNIVVSDNGKGMEATVLNSLLSGLGTTTKFDGHGIGFKFVVEQCSKNHFALTGQSEPGKGTTFTLLLPAARKEHSAHDLEEAA